MVDFWLGIEKGKKKMQWQSSEWLSTPKTLGGMGFRDLVLFNKAMLRRQCWRLLTDPSSLCARVLKDRYFHNCDLWDAPILRLASFTWRNICFGMQLVRQGIKWSVGNDNKIMMLADYWIPGTTWFVSADAAPGGRHSELSVCRGPLYMGHRHRALRF
jgi:hypothetical protein